MEYYKKYLELKRDNHVFTYTGPLSFDDVVLLRQLIEKILELQEVENKQKRKIVNIIIEALQNIQLHGVSIDSDKSRRECFLFLGKENGYYILLIGNFVENKLINHLKEKIEALKHLSIPQLKELYLSTLDRGEISDKGGASLGLVKMFLDSSKNSNYDFNQVDDEYSFFTLEMKVFQ